MDKISNQNHEHSVLYQATLVMIFFALLIILAAIYKACESWYPRLLDIIKFQPWVTTPRYLLPLPARPIPWCQRNRPTAASPPCQLQAVIQHSWGAALGGSCSHQKTLRSCHHRLCYHRCSLRITPTKCLIYYKKTLKCKSRWNRTSNNRRSGRQSSV